MTGPLADSSLKESTPTTEQSPSSKLPCSEKQVDLEPASMFAAGERTCYQPKTQITGTGHVTQVPARFKDWIETNIDLQMKLLLLTLGSYLHPWNCSWFLLLFDRQSFDSVRSDYHVLSTNLFACNQASFINKKKGMSQYFQRDKPYMSMRTLFMLYSFACVNSWWLKKIFEETHYDNASGLHSLTIWME